MESKLFAEIVFSNYPTKNISRLCVGGTTKYFVQTNNFSSLINIIKYCIKNSIKYIIIGDGSNLYFTDGMYDGLIIKNNISNIDIIKSFTNEDIFIVSSGTKLMDFVIETAKLGYDCSYLSGIPGTIGGAIYGNAGAYGTEIKDLILGVTVIDKLGNTHLYNNTELKFTYRNSILKTTNDIIMMAYIKLKIGDIEQIQLNIENILNIRKSKLPPDNIPTAGSFYKNLNIGENKISVAQILDKINCKQLSCGGASIYYNHSNIIINKEGFATTKDINDLNELIKKTVLDKFGIVLEEEVQFIQ
jgi:UDP-N-acetylmuramate dehydrogenase